MVKQETIYTLNDIRPDGTGKYCKNIYRWVRRWQKRWHKNPNQLPQAWNLGPEIPDPRAGYSQKKDLLIGVYSGDVDDGLLCILGCKTVSISGPFTGKSTRSAAYPVSKKPQEITDWLWREYVDKGRCFFIGDLAHTWLQINTNSRKCKHCGKHEVRRIKTVRSIKRVESWEKEEAL